MTTNTYSLKEQIVHGAESFPFAYYRVDEKHLRYIMASHWHEEMELIHITEGKLTVHLDSQTYVVTAGEYIAIMPNVLHSAIPENCKYECIVFDVNALLNNHLTSDTLLFYITHSDANIKPNFYKFADKRLKNCLQELFQLMDTSPLSNSIKLQVYGLSYFLFGLLDDERYYYIIDNKDNVASKMLKFKTVQAYIQKKYMYEIKLENLSEILEMGTTNVIAFFKDTIGMTPIDYINSFRVEKARQKIIENNKSITQIAYECGFFDLSYFIKVFKKYSNNMTPRAFAKHHQNTDA